METEAADGSPFFSMSSVLVRLADFQPQLRQRLLRRSNRENCWLAVLVVVVATPVVRAGAQWVDRLRRRTARRAMLCSAGTDQRMPTVAALRQRTPEAILDALVTGAMRQQGAELTDAERRAVAAVPRRADQAPRRRRRTSARCANPAPFDPTQGASWSGWGPDSVECALPTGGASRPHGRRPRRSSN